MSDRPGEQHGWVSAHIYCHNALDPLLTGLVGPLVDELAAQQLANEWFYVRHWAGGPHVRLRVLPRHERLSEPVRTHIQWRCNNYLLRGPAPDMPSQQAYSAVARVLAELEGVSDYPETLRPDHSMAFEPYRRETEKFGSGATVKAVERHFAESSRLALTLVRQSTPTTQRRAVAFAALLISWWCGTTQPPSAAWLPLTQPPLLPDGDGDCEGDGGGDHTTQEELLWLARQARLMATSGPADDADGVLAAWTRSMHRLRNAIGISSATDRVADACAHLFCNRVGVDVAAEGQLRRMAVRVVTELEPAR